MCGKRQDCHKAQKEQCSGHKEQHTAKECKDYHEECCCAKKEKE